LIEDGKGKKVYLVGRTSDPKREDMGGWRVDVGDDQAKEVES